MEQPLKNGTFFRTIKPLIIILKYLGHCSIHNLQANAAADIEIEFNLLYSCWVCIVHLISILGFLAPIEFAEFRVYLLYNYIVSFLTTITILRSDQALKNFAVEMDRYDFKYNSSELNYKISLNIPKVLTLIEISVEIVAIFLLAYLKPIHLLLLFFCGLPKIFNGVLIATIQSLLAKRFLLLTEMWKSQKTSFLEGKKESQYQIEEMRIFHANLTTITNKFSHDLTCRLSILFGPFVLSSLFAMYSVYKFGKEGIIYISSDHIITGVLTFWIVSVADALVLESRAILPYLRDLDTTDLPMDCKFQIELFLTQMEARPVNITINRFCQVNRELLTSMLMFCTTYVIVCIQLDEKLGLLIKQISSIVNGYSIFDLVKDNWIYKDIKFW